MNAVIERPQTGLVESEGRMSVQQVVQHAMVVQEVMKAVMKDGVHFGTIKGTDKPTLLQPGADKLCMVFRIAQEFTIEDLSTSDAVRYRVTCRGVHQSTGVVLGSCVGEASSSEEKYKWRRAVSDAEFNATPEHLKRTKFGKDWTTKQVRTEPADVANTVLKMAEKRAKIGMVLNVTGASDMFGQDLDDLDAALRDSMTGSDEGAPPAPAPAPAAPATWPADAFKVQHERWTKAIGAGLKTHDEILAMARSKGALTKGQEEAIRNIPGPAPQTSAPAEATAAPAPAPAPTPAADGSPPWEGGAASAPAVAGADNFVADMERAEGAQGGDE